MDKEIGGVDQVQVVLNLKFAGIENPTDSVRISLVLKVGRFIQSVGFYHKKW